MPLHETLTRHGLTDARLRITIDANRVPPTSLKHDDTKVAYVEGVGGDEYVVRFGAGGPVLNHVHGTWTQLKDDYGDASPTSASALIANSTRCR